MSRTLHIVSFNVPFPANYGGVIDVYYKIKALYEHGVKIHLHCFQYGRDKAEELEQLCESVTYYDRNKKLNDWFSRTPFIVKTRNSQKLLHQLKSIVAPILFEGLHCTSLLSHPDLSDRYKIVRTHNIEHDYYHQLSQSTNNILKGIFFKSEALKLKQYESNLEYAQLLLAISNNDVEYFQSHFDNVEYLPAFHGTSEIDIKTGKGNYLFFHGDLSVYENIKALDFILDNVFPHINYHLIIAGKTPDKSIIKKIECNHLIKLIENPPQEEMDKLIQNAQAILLPTFQATGIKLKLLHSLNKGRHCIVNSAMIDNTGLESLCHKAESPNEWIDTINHLMNVPIGNEDIQKRVNTLSNTFDDMKNAEIILKYLR